MVLAGARHEVARSPDEVGRVAQPIAVGVAVPRTERATACKDGRDFGVLQLVGLFEEVEIRRMAIT
jgi:hypothetical protein